MENSHDVFSYNFTVLIKFDFSQNWISTQNFVFGKDMLVEGITPDKRIDVTVRQKHITEHK